MHKVFSARAFYPLSWRSLSAPDLAGLFWPSHAPRGRLEVTVNVLAVAVMAAFTAHILMSDAADSGAETAATTTAPTAAGTEPTAMRPAREILFSFYVSQPFYYRSDVKLTRNDDTDVTFKQIGWDGDMLMPPIDGGLRSVEWFRNFGFMVDFLHNKAVSRLGFGAHGRKIPNPVIDVVEAEGKIAGKPVESPVELRKIFKRLEHTHGHNVLLFTPMLRFGSVAWPVRPYVGVGAGFAVPHVEVRFQGEEKKKWTNEYQYVGPAAQAVAGLEFRFRKWGFFLEYKFSHAWVDAALTGGKSWKNFNLPGDLYNQFMRWWRSEKPEGRVQTHLTAHQIAGGFGRWVTVRKAVPVAP